MIISKIFLFCLLRVISGGAAHGWQNVSRTAFQSTIKENEITLVAFIMPWTEPSKALEPEWSSAAAQSKQPLIAIDCSVETQLCEDTGVISYPAIRLFQGGETVARYRGPRKASAITAFVHRSTFPMVSFLDSTNITAFKSSDESVFIAYLPPPHDYLTIPLTTLATRNRGKFSFGFVSDAAIPAEQNIPVPSIVYYENPGGEPETYSGVWTIRALEKFIETATAPLIAEMTLWNESKYLQSGKSLIYIFAETETERSKFRSSLNSLAKKYQEYITFVTIDAVEHSAMLPGLGLEDGKFPSLSLQNTMLGQVFPYKQGLAITRENVESFVLDIVEGNTKPMETSDAMAHTEL